MPPSYSSLSASISLQRRRRGADRGGLQQRHRADRDLLQPVVAADAVALVDEVVAGRQHARSRRPRRAARPWRACFWRWAWWVRWPNTSAAVTSATPSRGDAKLCAGAPATSVTPSAAPGRSPGAARRTATPRAASTPNSRSLRLCESHAIATRSPSRAPALDRGDQRLGVLGVAERPRVVELVAQRAEVVDLDPQPSAAGVVRPCAAGHAARGPAARSGAPRVNAPSSSTVTRWRSGG